MSTPQFTVALRDLDSGPRTIQGPMTRDFLAQLLGDTEVTPYGDAPSTLTLTVENTDPQILVRGRLDVTIAVPCARTLDPAVYRLQPEVFLLLSKVGADAGASQGMQRRARPARSQAQLAQVEAKRTAAGKSKIPKSSGKAAGAWDDDPELGEQDAAHDVYSGDEIVLDQFIREFILLEIPMIPLREDLRSPSFEASPPPPSAASQAEVGQQAVEEKPLDPRLSPLADILARLEKKKE